MDLLRALTNPGSNKMGPELIVQMLTECDIIDETVTDDYVLHVLSVLIEDHNPVELEKLIRTFRS